MTQQFEAGVLSALRTRMTGVFPAQIRSCLEVLTDDEIWMTPNPQCNSVGNIVRHLTGSLTHFIGRGLGGFAYERDRPSEFVPGGLSRTELTTAFDEMVARLEATFDGLGPERLAAESTEPGLFSTIFEDLLNAALHFSNHAGQIVWITKSLREGGAGKELWMVTHKRHGGWKSGGAAAGPSQADKE